MRDKKITAVLMSVFMMLSLLPSTVFAAAVTALEGNLKIQGTAAVGEKLSADLKEVKPEGLSEDGISYIWSRKASADTENKNLKEISKEKTYTLTQEDLGSKIVLVITGLEDKGFSGTLKAETGEVAEAPSDTSSQENETADTQTEDTEVQPQETPEQSQETAEVPEEEVLEPIPETETEEFIEEVPETEESYEDLPHTEDSEDTSEEAGSEAMDGIPAAQEDGTVSEEDTTGTSEEDLLEDQILIPDDPSDTEEAGSESVDGIPQAQPDDPSQDEAMETPEEENGNGDSGETPETNMPAAEIVGNDVLDFGTLTVSQLAENPVQYITIKNTGNVPLNFIPIDETTSPYFAGNDIGTLESQQEITVAIWPRETLAPNSYSDTQIEYQTVEGVTVSFTVNMELTEDPVTTPTEPSLKLDKTELLFESKESQTVIITNSSDADITLKASTANGYVIAVPDGEVIVPAGGTQEFTITLSDTLEAGREYTDTVTFTDTANEENKVAVSVRAVVPIEPEKSDVAADKSDLDFGTVIEGYAQASGSQTVNLKNNGKGAAVLSAPVSQNGEAKYFDVALDKTDLPAGETAILTVVPKTGLTAESYSESFTVTDQTTGNKIVVTARMTVAPVKHSLSASVSKLEFAAVKKGYGQIEAQQITVTNNGNVAETLVQPSGGNFEVSQVEASALTVQPGGSVSFTVRPKTGLDVNTYQETLKIASQAAEVSVALSFQVIKGTATINKIETPKAIKGLPNGTKKNAKAMGLPSVVVIGTSSGSMNASVAWDVENCGYDPSSTQEQTFTVKGKVKLPEGVDNNNNLTLATTIQVNVKGYTPKLASAEDNKVTGIEYNGVYTTQSKISFTAVGAGMDNAAPRTGDTRYLPVTWNVINTYNLKPDSYSASFGMAKSGDYTLKVNFQLQTYDGKNWKSEEKYDTRKVPFTISKAKVTAPGQNLTPAANRRNAVKTGDDTPIAGFVIILVVAVAAIAGVIIYRRKK